jgi:hypothetical protein
MHRSATLDPSAMAVAMANRPPAFPIPPVAAPELKNPGSLYTGGQKRGRPKGSKNRPKDPENFGPAPAGLVADLGPAPARCRT